MKNSSIWAVITVVLLSTSSKAQFVSGQRFVEGGYTVLIGGLSSIDPNSSRTGGYYSHGVGVMWGSFSRDNKATGWRIGQGMGFSKVPDYQPSAPQLLNFNLSGERFVEYYTSLHPKVALFARPSVGLTCGLQNTYGSDPNEKQLFRETQRHSISLGLNFSAGLAWRFAPKWMLYGIFSIKNPVDVSVVRINNESKGTKSNSVDFNFSPELNTGNVGFGFRYFYDRRN